jgi:hypothetical protein
MIQEFNQFVEDVKGIFKNPTDTLSRLMEEKQWINAFLFISISVFIITYLMSPSLLQQMAQRFPDSPLASFSQATMLKKVLLSGFTVFFLFIRLSLVAFFIYLFFGIGGAKGIYINFFSITMNAAIIGTLIPFMIQNLLIVLHIDLPSISSLVVLTPKLKEGWLYQILSQIEFFSLWSLTIIALGIAENAQIKRIKSIFIGVLYFIFKASILVLFAMLMIKLKQSLGTLG